MKWVVCWDNPRADSVECQFYKTLEAAMNKVDELMAEQDNDH